MAGLTHVQRECSCKFRGSHSSVCRRQFPAAKKLMEQVAQATETRVHSTANCTAVCRYRLRMHWRASLCGFPSSTQASRISEYTGVILDQEEALVILKPSEYLAKLQGRHYECHLSQLHRRADIPIKSMITLFFPQRKHTAIKAERRQQPVSDGPR